VCWASSCPSGYKACGPALCLKVGISCSKTISNQVSQVFNLIGKAADKGEDVYNMKKFLTGNGATFTDVTDQANKVINAFSLDIC
jgi:hypothetical protein